MRLVLSSSFAPAAEVGSEPDGKPGSVDEAAADDDAPAACFGSFVIMNICGTCKF